MRLPLSSLISAYGLISVFQTPGSFAVDSFVFPNTDNDDLHNGIFTDDLIDNPNTGGSQLDLQQAGQIVPTLIAERLSIAALVNRQGICADFIDCLINSFSH